MSSFSMPTVPSLKSSLSSLNKGNYPYVTARVRGKKKNLLTVDTYPKLMKMGPSQIARLLGEAAYHKEMTELASKYSGNELVERALNLNLARTYREILEFSKGDLRRILEAYLDWWNVYNIKVILRGLHHYIPKAEIKDYLVPAASLRKDFLESLVDMETVDDVVTALGKHGYRTPPDEDVKQICEVNCGLRPVEDYYDRSYYAKLLESAKGRSKPARIYRTLVQRTIDTVNAANLMEMLQDGVDPTHFREYMVPGGEKLSVDRLCELSAMKPEDALKAVKEALGSELGGVDASSANMVAIQLDSYLMQLSGKLSTIYPLSILPVIDFIIRKEKETTFLRIIVKGKEHALPEEKIRGLLAI
ncbi:MAG: ATP synthase A1 subunit C [Thermoplasmata archaeon]|nr:ATP synthase A1 subunit C [Thermoplasmata archaeon]